MEKLYNPLKLSEHRSKFTNKKILIIGGGAVGTNVAEDIAKMGSSLDIIDFDSFTLENAAKHSSLVRTPEDVGRNKAECVSSRVQPILENGCHSNGINADLCMLGPEAIAEYDYVFLSVDNYAAKVLMNELLLSIPQERRPITVQNGTYDEMAQSVILDGKEFCLHCLISDDWFDNSSIRTSCSGVQVRKIDGVSEIIRTSGLASRKAADISAEQYRAHVIGIKNVINHRITYTAFPNLELSSAKPMRRKNCPGCAIQPPEKIQWLTGNVLDITLDQLLHKIEADLGTNEFEVASHQLNYKKVTYSEFIITYPCRCCGSEIEVMKHESRTYSDDLICRQCRNEEKPIQANPNLTLKKTVNFFNCESNRKLKDSTLFQLGYPLGAHIKVIQRSDAFDFLDSEKIILTTFAFSGDAEKMHVIRQL